MEQKEMLINGALTAALCAWTLLSFDPRLRPIQIGTIAYLLTFLKKLHRLDPSPEGRDNPAKKTADNVRGASCLPLSPSLHPLVRVRCQGVRQY
jgi:hypothetical protein